AAGVQHRHHHLGGGTALLRMDVDRDSAAVVADADRTVVEDGDHHLVAIAGQRLVDRVVDHLEHHVVQAGAVISIADVHAGALAHRFQALEDLDVAGIVMGFVGGFVHAMTVSWRQRPARHGAVKGRTGLCKPAGMQPSDYSRRVSSPCSTWNTRAACPCSIDGNSVPVSSTWAVAAWSCATTDA